MGFELLALTPERGGRTDAGCWQHPAVRALARRRLLRTCGDARLIGLASSTRSRSRIYGRRGPQRDTPPLGDRRLGDGHATALRLGRTIASYEIVITNDAGERVCTARVTCQLVTPRVS